MKLMKYILYTSTAILLIGLLSFKSTEHQLLPTKLRITVIDGLGNPAEGATVTIYGSKEDYTGSENPVQTGVTDSKGRITFKDLEPKSYFIDARKNDMNNDGEGVQTASLEEGKLNKVNTVIE